MVQKIPHFFLSILFLTLTVLSLPAQSFSFSTKQHLGPRLEKLNDVQGVRPLSFYKKTALPW